MDFPSHDRGVRRNERDADRSPKVSPEDVRDLRESVDRLALVCRAMWELMKESGLTEEALLEKVEEVDLADGVIDGRHRPPPQPCSSCSRPNHPKRRVCLYCGAVVVPPSAFDSV